MNYGNYYQRLIKPEFSPPNWIFGPVWGFLYVIIFSTFGYVFYLFANKKLPFIVILPFILNLIFNFSFTYLQFTLKNNLLASVDILLVLITIIWMFIAIWNYERWIVYANIPYLVWVSFATILQLSITYLNWK